MQLERASSHSGEAGLVGWISTNDVTLFTMVLVVLIALLLNSNLLKKSKALDVKSAEAKALLKDLDSTSAELGETSQQRDSLDEQLAANRRSLEATSERLRITQEERAALKEQLDKTVAMVAALNENLKGLKTEKSELETAKSDLVKKTDDLTVQASTLTKEKTTLNEQLAALGGQLNEKLKALKDVEAQRERLEQQANELDAIVATLQAKLTAAGVDLVAMQKLSEQEKALAAAQLKALEVKATAESAKAEDYLARLRRAAELFKGWQAEKQELTTQLTDTKTRFQQFNRELVGIHGSLKRVAVLFDASGSMKEAGNGGGDRWQEAQMIARTWLQHLDVDECVLIVYSSDVRTFPTDGTLANVRGENGEAARHALLEHLTGVEPKGWTNTLEAMRKAYTYEGIDSMILFSDGAPTNPNLGRFDQGVANEIYALCRKHEKIPVNTVGLGNYFDEDLGTFLRTVANLTGGTFLGR